MEGREKPPPPPLLFAILGRIRAASECASQPLAGVLRAAPTGSVCARGATFHSIDDDSVVLMIERGHPSGDEAARPATASARRRRHCTCLGMLLREAPAAAGRPPGAKRGENFRSGSCSCTCACVF
jgi:hypothetical protein